MVSSDLFYLVGIGLYSLSSREKYSTPTSRARTPGFSRGILDRPYSGIQSTKQPAWLSVAGVGGRCVSRYGSQSVSQDESLVQTGVSLYAVQAGICLYA